VRADSGTREARFALKHSAPAACPDARAFSRQVQARTSRATLVQDGSAEQTLSVLITERGAGYRGTLRTRSVEGAHSERTIDAADCGEVTAALALVAALALDPNARTEPLADADLDGANRETPQAPPERVPAPERRPPTSTRVPRTAADTREGASEADLAWAWGAGISLDASSGIAPAWLFASRVHAWVELWPEAWYSPAVQLSAAAGTRAFEHSLTEVALSWRSIRLEACPVKLAPSDRVSLRPCLLFDAGELTGEAGETETVSSRQATRPWYALGALARLMWSPARPLTLHAQAGASVPLRRDTFALASAADEPLIPVHEVPAAGLVLALGLGFEFR